MISFTLRGIAIITGLAALLTGAALMPGRPALAQGPTAPAARKLPPPGSAAKGEIVLKVPDGMPRDQVAGLADQAGCEIAYEIPYSPSFYVVRLKGTAPVTGVQRPAAVAAAMTPEELCEMPSEAVKNAIGKLQSTPGVLADPNIVLFLRGSARSRQQTGPARFVPNDPLYPIQRWHMDMIRAPEAWAIQRGLRPVIVAVTDSGIDDKHPDFLRADGTTSALLPHIDVGLTPPAIAPAFDFFGHGTHVSGTISATTNNAIGVTGVGGYEGGGVNIKILPINITFDPQPFAFLSGGVAGVNYSIQAGAQVHNMSWGGLGVARTLELVVGRAVAAGQVVVAAAGNAQYTGGLSIPDVYPGVIRVTSVGPDRQLASYSNYGPSVTIAAPGGDPVDNPAPALTGAFGTMADVWSTWPLQGGIYSPTTVGYEGISGTSMASPHVAGAAALLIACGAEPAEVKGILMRTAQKQPDEDPVLTGGFSKYGAGLLDVYAAVRSVVDPDPTIRIVGPADLGLTFQRRHTIQVQVKGTGRLDGTPGRTDSNVVIEVRRATGPADLTSPLVTFIGGRDFTVPKPTGTQPRNQTFTISLPEQGRPDLILQPGRYRITARITSVNESGQTVVSESSQFLEIGGRTQESGRSLFAMPFKVRQVSATPEAAAFGSEGSFRLLSWDAFNGEYRPAWDFGFPDAPFTHVRNSANDGDQNGFGPLGPNGEPLTWEVTNPAVSIAPVGIGYWLDRSTGGELNVPPGSAEVNNPVGIRLYGATSKGNGWNLIGNPYIYPVNWNTVNVQPAGTGIILRLEDAIAQQFIQPVLIGWQGDYVYQIAPEGQLIPFHGYWVRALKDCILIIPPTQGAGGRSVSRSAKGSSTLPALENGWRVRLSASVGGDRDGQNYFGQAGDAKAGEDSLDLPKPPAAGSAYVRFVGSSSDGRSTGYAHDMRPASGTGAGRQEWTVAVTSGKSDSNVTLTWDGLGNAPRRTRFTLTDTVTGAKVALRNRSSYTFRAAEAGATRLFKLTMEPVASVGPLAITNVSVASGRGMQGGMAIRLTTNQDADVTARITTITGKPIAPLGGSGATRAAAAQELTLRWDGRSANGGPVPVGGYLVEITARSSDGQVTTIKRPIQFTR